MEWGSLGAGELGRIRETSYLPNDSINSRPSLICSNRPIAKFPRHCGELRIILSLRLLLARHLFQLWRFNRRGRDETQSTRRRRNRGQVWGGGNLRFEISELQLKSPSAPPATQSPASHPTSACHPESATRSDPRSSHPHSSRRETTKALWCRPPRIRFLPENMNATFLLRPRAIRQAGQIPSLPRTYSPPRSCAHQQQYSLHPYGRCVEQPLEQCQPDERPLM